MKKNNDSPYYKDWTTQKLKREAKAYDQLINVVQCYGKNDMFALIKDHQDEQKNTGNAVRKSA